MKHTFYNIDGRNVGDVLIARFLTSDIRVLNTFGFDAITIPNIDNNIIGDIIREGTRLETYATIIVGNQTFEISGGSPNFIDPTRTNISVLDSQGAIIQADDFMPILQQSPFCEVFAPAARVPQGFTPIDTTGSTQIDDSDPLINIPANFQLAQEFFTFVGQDCNKVDIPSILAWLQSNYSEEQGYQLSAGNTYQTIAEGVLNNIDVSFCSEDEVIDDPTSPTIEEIAQEYYFSPTGLNENCNNIPSGAMAGEQYAGMTSTWLAQNYPQLFPNAPYSTGSNQDGMLDAVTQVQSYITQNYCADQVQPVGGCTDASAANYNPYATIDDGSCITNFDLNTNPNGVAESANAELLGSLAVLNTDYGDLIQDTIQLINELQSALDAALENVGVPQSEVDALNDELNAAKNRLSDILGADGMISLITSAVQQAENGTYNQQIIDNILQTEKYGYLQNDNPNAYSSLQTLHESLQTINDYKTQNESLNTTNAGLNNDIAALQDQLDNITPEDGITATDVQAVQTKLDALILNIENALANTTSTTAGDLSAPDLTSVGEQSGNSVFNLVSSYNNLVTAYNNLAEDASILVQDDGIGQAEVDAAVNDAITNTLAAINDAGLNTSGLSTAELTSALQEYVAQYVSTSNLVEETDVMLSNAEFQQDITNAIRAYVNNFINDQLDGSNATATQNLQNYIDGLVAAEVASAFGEGAASVTPEDGVSQSDLDAAVADAQAQAAEDLAALQLQLDALQLDLNEANATINNFELGAINNNTISNQTLQEAYATIDQLIEDADAQFQIYANDIAAYQQFLVGLDETMVYLENFLTDNYGYNPDSEDKFTIPTNTLPTLVPEDDSMNQAQPFSGRGGMRMSEIYLNFAGRAVNLSRGFKRFGGQPMRSNMLSANGTEARFELNPKAKNIVAITGVVLASFGIYTLLKKK